MVSLRASLLMALAIGCARGEPRPNGVAPCCVSSASAKPSAASSAMTTPAATSPDQAWQHVLEALRAADDGALARVATANGVASLEKGAAGEPKGVAFTRWGTAWSAWEVRWKSRGGDRAEASLGPEIKEHGLTFVRTADGWKLERWAPGE